jgi:2-iminobutanoate/2-iminopropanoate deaminase
VIRPGYGAEKEVVSTGTPPLGHESEAVKGGPLLWISGQMAADRGGLLTPEHTSAQLPYIFGRLRDICEAGGTELANMLLLRAFVTDVRDGYAVYGALREWIPNDPPAVSIVEVPGPLAVPGASVVVDGVAYVPPA